MNHKCDLGGNAIVNEGGQSLFGSFKCFNNLIRFDAGNIWFGEQAAPFTTASIRPEVNIWRFKALYYGRVTAMANMPSWLYTSHAIGLGYSQPLDAKDNWHLRMGGVWAGAMSFPTYSDMYSSISAGASLQYKNWMAYAASNFYWAADDPIKTAYLWYYKPQFESLNLGIQASFLDQYTARLFVDPGVIKTTEGIRLSRSLFFGNLLDGAAVDIFLGPGMSEWNSSLGGRLDWGVTAGLTIVTGGKYFNSTSSVVLEHFQAGGIPLQVQTDIPTAQDPGPYGFGRTGTPAWNATVNEAKQNMAQNPTWSGFNASYASASESSKLMTARFILAFMGQVAYQNNAEAALMQGDILNPNVKAVASTDLSTIYGYLRRYAAWYDSNNGPLPADLANGIAICAGAHQIAADFLNSNGIPAKVMSINTPKGPHTIAMAMPADGTYLLDWGSQFNSGPKSWDQLMTFYGRYYHSPTFESQIFGPDKYIGTYVTPEGRLLHQTIGTYTPYILLRDFLGVH